MVANLLFVHILYLSIPNSLNKTSNDLLIYHTFLQNKLKCVSDSTLLQNLHVFSSCGIFGLAYLPLSIFNVCALA